MKYNLRSLMRDLRSLMRDLRNPSGAIVPCVGLFCFAVLILWAAFGLQHTATSRTIYLCFAGFFALFALKLLRVFLRSPL
jgi:hypothetical protein